MSKRHQNHDGETIRESWPELVGTHRLWTDSEGSSMKIDVGPLHVGDNCVAWSVCGTSITGTRTCPWCMNWLFGTYFLWWDALPTLNTKEQSLVLPQLDMPCRSGQKGVLDTLGLELKMFAVDNPLIHYKDLYFQKSKWTGINHFIQDFKVSSNNQLLFSCMWLGLSLQWLFFYFAHALFWLF